MKEIKFIMADFHQLSQVFFFLAHNRSQPILGLFSSQKQKYFYNFAITNMKYTNIECESYIQLLNQPDLPCGKICVLMDIPTDFQTMEKVLRHIQSATEITVVLMRHNRKYVNMIKKKIGSVLGEIVVTECPQNGLVGINKKLRDLVDQSYDMNRAGFYAYGAYLNNYRANMLKFIFKTEDIDVAGLAKSYGFTTPPRVKEGSFLKTEVRKLKVKQRSKQKKLLKKEKILNKGKQSAKNEESTQKKSSLQKIKALAAKKTKKIMKQKQKPVKKIIKAQTPSAPSTQLPKKKKRISKQ